MFFTRAGNIRNYNISKKEWVLDGDTVIYGGANILKETLDYDFRIEKEFDYSNLSTDEFIKHIANFIANLWQIHVFAEGNTRTTAVFLIKYLRKFGFKITNDIFGRNARYFRNSLVRANYTNVKKGIYKTTEYLELFLRNLIFKENNTLKNRYLHINWDEKVDIDSKKVDIDDSIVDIRSLKLTSTLQRNITILYNALPSREYFGRSDIIRVLDFSPSGASKFISKLLELNVIVRVNNRGKGKYTINIKGI